MRQFNVTQQSMNQHVKCHLSFNLFNLNVGPNVESNPRHNILDKKIDKSSTSALFVWGLVAVACNVLVALGVKGFT